MDTQSVASIFLYMLATFLLAANIFNIIDKTKGKNIFIFFIGIFALALHAQILHQSIFLYIGLYSYTSFYILTHPDIILQILINSYISLNIFIL